MSPGQLSGIVTSSCQSDIKWPAETEVGREKTAGGDGGRTERTDTSVSLPPSSPASQPRRTTKIANRNVRMSTMTSQAASQQESKFLIGKGLNHRSILPFFMREMIWTKVVGYRL